MVGGVTGSSGAGFSTGVKGSGIRFGGLNNCLVNIGGGGGYAIIGVVAVPGPVECTYKDVIQW